MNGVEDRTAHGGVPLCDTVHLDRKAARQIGQRRSGNVVAREGQNNTENISSRPRDHPY